MGTGGVALIFTIILFGTAYALARRLCIMLHELGHAIPALLLTKNHVIIHLGFRSGIVRTGRITVKRLTLYYRKNFFQWRGGLCRHSYDKLTYKKNLIIVLMGPLSSILIASIALHFALNTEIHGLLKLLIYVFFAAAVTDLFNLVPRPEPYAMEDGSVVYNDGSQLKKLFAVKNHYGDIYQLFQLYNERRYQDYVNYFDSLNLQFTDLILYRTTIYSYLNTKNYEKARAYSDEHFKGVFSKKLTSYDYCNEAIIRSCLHDHETALSFYNRAIKLDRSNVPALNNRGFTLTLLNRYAEALGDLNHALNLNADFAYAYSTRGYARIKLDLVEEGFQDITRSIELDNENAYAYRNLGIYYINKGSREQALTNLRRAQEIDPLAYDLDKLIDEAKALPPANMPSQIVNLISPTAE